MKLSQRLALSPAVRCAIVLAGIPLFTASLLSAEMPGSPDGAGQVGRDPSRPAPVCEPASLDSPYIPVDSWIYPAVLRLYSLGYLDNVFLGMRPWTRASVSNMLDQAGGRIDDADPGPATDEAQAIYGFVDLRLAMGILIGSSIGSQLGVLTTHHLPNRVLRLAFGGLVGLTVLMIIADLVHGLLL